MALIKLTVSLLFAANLGIVLGSAQGVPVFHAVLFFA